jgi:hypothetical protein
MWIAVPQPSDHRTLRRLQVLAICFHNNGVNEAESLKVVKSKESIVRKMT